MGLVISFFLLCVVFVCDELSNSRSLNCEYEKDSGLACGFFLPRSSFFLLSFFFFPLLLLFSC